MAKPKQIGTLADLVRFVEHECREGQFLFRGQRSDKPLLPKLARNNQSDILNLEQAMLKEFKRRSLPYLASPPADDWDWLTIAQHSGMATRLLDWTDNPLAALWFAVRKRPLNDKPAAVSMFEVPSQDVLDHEKLSGSPFEGRRTAVFQPRHIKTVAAQGGWFTVHKYVSAEKRFIPLERNRAYKSHLEKLLVPSDYFSELKNQLNRCGINAASLFPSLYGLSEHVESTFLPGLF